MKFERARSSGSLKGERSPGKSKRNGDWDPINAKIGMQDPKKVKDEKCREVRDTQPTKEVNSLTSSSSRIMKQKKPRVTTHLQGEPNALLRE